MRCPWMQVDGDALRARRTYVFSSARLPADESDADDYACFLRLYSFETSSCEVLLTRFVSPLSSV